MLRIGFSTKYFTLWNVEKTTEFKNVDGLNLPFTKMKFDFIRNLSTEESEAVKKACFLGCEDLDIDFELYGVKSSFEKVRENHSRKPSDESFFFEFGKYKDLPILNCPDPDYLFWYFIETQNVNCREELLKNFGFVEYNGILIQGELGKQLFRREELIQKIIQDKKIIGQMVGNLNSEGVGLIEIENGVVLSVVFGVFRVYEYKGRKYGLPVKSNKAKRVKGEVLEIEVGDYIDEKFYVESFKIIKSQIIY